MAGSVRSVSRRFAGAIAGALTIGLFTIGGGAIGAVGATVQPAVTHDYAHVTSSEAPPTQEQCASLSQPTGRRCFAPDAIRNSYNIGPLYEQGFDGTGYTIALVDSFGSVNIRSDLKVFNDSFGLPHMCGEDGMTCEPGMPTFDILQMGNVSPTPTGQNGTGQEDHSLWALEVNLDVEWAHAIAPGANILLVTTPTAETLGVQGFQQFMMAEDYVVKHNLADIISQSFGSAEDAFSSKQSLLNLRYAFKDAQKADVTVLASSGDNGSAGTSKQPVGQGGSLLPNPTVSWPGSDPLVTGVGGTYLCTDPETGTHVDNTDPPTNCQVTPAQREIGWIASGGGFSDTFSRPSYQDALPPGSTPIPDSSRGVPDVGYQASSRTGVLVYITEPTYPGATCPDGNPCSPGWYVVGGTSSGSPQWAGLVAIADQINGGRLGLINQALYDVANDAGEYANDYYDVTTGNNGDFAPTVPGYDATTGWDPVTGVGTPNASNLLPDLVAAS